MASRPRRFRKGQSGNPRGPRGKNPAALLVAALNEPVYVTTDGKRHKITKREAIVTQLVNESAGADLHATKMLIDMLKEVEPHRTPRAGQIGTGRQGGHRAVHSAAAPPDRGRGGQGCRQPPLRPR